MKFKKTKIKNLFVLFPKVVKDRRGFFYRNYCLNQFSAKGINFSIKQCNVSKNLNKGTLRGFHYTSTEHAESKIMSCLNGEIFLAIIDLRKNSKTFMNKFFIRISSINKKSIIIPAGCANAFLTLKKNTIVQYYMSDFYKKKYERSFNFKDPKFKFNWPIKPKVISVKDKTSKFYFK